MEKTIQLYRKYIMQVSKGMDPFVVDTAEGAVIRDTSGREYLDCFSGIAVNNVGHRHPEVIKAAEEQMKKHLHCCSYVYYLKPVAALAEKLAEITPGGLERSFFGNSGAEAVEGAMKLARKYTEKKEFLALEHSFHGRTYGALSLTAQKKYKQGMGPYLSGVVFAPAPYCFRCKMHFPECDFECARSVERVIDTQTSGDLAAMFLEPVMGEGGIILPPSKEYFKIVSEILEKHEALLVADEVQTGFGRTGGMFASEHFGIDADIMTLAKGMGGGFPLGAFIAKPELADAFQAGDHMSTFGGNPVSCAAALATIEVILREKLPARAEKLGKTLGKKLLELKEEFPAIGDVRGIGLMYGIELAEPKSKSPMEELAAKIKDALRERGFLVGKGGFGNSVIRIQPPLVVTEAQLSSLIESLREVLMEVARHEGV